MIGRVWSADEVTSVDYRAIRQECGLEGAAQVNYGKSTLLGEFQPAAGSTSYSYLPVTAFIQTTRLHRVRPLTFLTAL